jgi:hypothetical protein
MLCILGTPAASTMAERKGESPSVHTVTAEY